MINKPHNFPVLLGRDDQDLEPVLEWLMTKEYIEIHDSESYVPIEKGRDSLSKFMARYTEYLNIFDIYCAVDLVSGEFAFSSYFDYDDKSSWIRFINDDRWDDLRVAVADYKKLDPVEIVFMSFVSENRFGRDQSGWQFDLLLGSVWDEIFEICDTAIQWDELGFEDDQGVFSAEEVTEDIIIQGAEVMIELHRREATLAPKYLDDYNDEPSENGEVTVERVIIEEYPVDYYHPYLDPFYVSPLWLGIWLL